jgi:hypothetical protein
MCDIIIMAIATNNFKMSIVTKQLKGSVEKGDKRQLHHFEKNSFKVLT